MTEPLQYPIGSQVRLRICPYGEPGTVIGYRRGKIIVEWQDLKMIGKHQPETIQTVTANP